MRKIQYLFLCLLALTLTACMSAAEQVMPSLQYHDPITLHVAKKASLYWQTGKQASSTMPENIQTNQGLVGAVLSSVLETEMRKNNPSRYTFTYGQPQQAVFMTSLKNVLADNHVFKDVEITTDPKAVPKNNVLITIYFKSTRVAEAQNNYKITLDVDLLVKSNGKVYKRTYLVESNPGGFFSEKGFKDQQTDVSQQLLSKVIAGLKQWHNQ